MKRFALLFLAATLIFNSCKKEETPGMVDDNFMPAATDSLISMGSFINEVHPTSGTVKLFENDDEFILQIENLQSDNGPDLRVYLSADKGISNSISLGALKAVSGNFSYSFAKSSMISDKPQVLIWCEDFSVLFGSALLQ